MNTQQMSELTFLYTVVNNPIEYKSRDKKDSIVGSSKENEDPLAWAYAALNWLFSKSLHASRALLSA